MTREDELVKRMGQGDPSAADELIKIFYPDILRYCLWHAPNRFLAEDAAQETFLKVIRYFDRYTHKGKFRSFLYQIAANTCIDMQRKNRNPDISLEESEIDPPYLDPSFEIIHSDMALIQLVDSLPKEQRERISFARFLTKQIRLTGWKIWIIQGIFLFTISLVIPRFYEESITLQRMIKRLVCLSILIFMTALPLLYRSVRYRMQEIEAASRFSGAKLLLARLIVVGIGDICLLTGIFINTMIKTLLPADSVVFCLCFPFLLSGSVCLYMLGHLSPRQFWAGSLLFCSFFAILSAAIPEQYAFLYQPSLYAARILLCAFLLAFCVWQLRYIIRTSSYEELQLT